MLTTKDEIAAYFMDHPKEPISFSDIYEAFEHIEQDQDAVWEVIQELLDEKRIMLQVPKEQEVVFRLHTRAWRIYTLAC